MSLVDALLLEPAPFHVWLAVRSDGRKGSGTISDPYDGSPGKFDGIMNLLPTSSKVILHLGPGEFQTNGYADGVSGGWQARLGMKVIGSGMDVTTLKRV